MFFYPPVNTFCFIICCGQYGKWTNSHIQHTNTWPSCAEYNPHYISVSTNYTGTELLNNRHSQEFTSKKKYLSQCGKCTYRSNSFTMYSCHNTFWPVHYSGWRLWASHLHKNEVFQFNVINPIVSNHNSHTNRLFHPTQQ